jgi:SAM-dependent methyltransferase
MAPDIIPKPSNEPLKLRGELCTSAAAEEAKHEHYHRYFFALQFCEKREVLDVGSREGYGSALLGITAQRVIGVDQSPDAVARASRNYRSARVSFTVGDYAAIPLSDASVDVVVSFETLEHIADREKFFCEIKRILRPDGLLVISEPNAKVKKELEIGPNPPQVNELDGAEFRAVLSQHFSNHRVLGQRSVVGSAIAPDPPFLTEGDRHQTFKATDSGSFSLHEGIGPATHFIAVASETALPEICHGLLDDGPFLRNLHDLLEQRAIAIREIEQRLRASVSNRDALQQQLEAAATMRDELQRELAASIANRDELQQRLEVAATIEDELQRQFGASKSNRDALQQQLEAAATIQNALQDKLRRRESEFGELHTRLSQLARDLQSRGDELAQSRATIARIYNSGSWRITWPLRFLRQIADEIRRRCVLLAGRLNLGGLFGHPILSNGTNSEPRDQRLPLPLEATNPPGPAPSPGTSIEAETELQVLQRSGLFDEQFYCEAYPDVRTGDISPLEHYFTVGGFGGRRPNRLFDSAYYLRTYSDVAKAGVNPALHYFQDGAREGRDPSAEFDTSYYLEANPDVATSGINPLVHFLRFGAAEGRLPLQPESEIQVLQRSGLFDEQYYCQAYPDVRTGELSPLEHYLTVGGFEGRRPNRLFDSAYYLRTYSDVAKASVNPALHYFQDGAREGRDPSAEFDTSYYLEANPDVATSEINPLVHFLRFGAQEGRFPRQKCYEHDLQKLGRLVAAWNRQGKLEYRPLVSVFMVTYNTSPIFLEAAVRSVMLQAYSNWELQIVDDGSSNSATLDTLGRLADLDRRIFVIRKAHHGGISDARNYALRDARGEYVATLDHDDELAFDALYEVVLALNTDRKIDVVYTDQCCVSPGGESTTHLSKPDWSPSLLRGVMYVGHLLIVRRSLALDVGGFASAFDGVQDFEFMLRISERTRKICHVPKVLYRRRQIAESVANGDKANGGVEQLQAAGVQAHLGRLGLDGLAKPVPYHSCRVIIEPIGPPPNTAFDLVVHCGAIPMAGARAINRALARTAHRPARIAVPAAWSGVEIAPDTTIDLLSDHTGRRFSDAERLTQFLAESCAEFVLAMSANVAIETDGWMELLVVAMQECEVAVACPAVLSADGLIAHAGLTVGSDACVRPAMRGFEPQSDGYAGSLSCAREISAAWADMVLLRRSAIAPLLPPKPVYITADFLVADLTLRATRAGLRALCVPYVRARQTMSIETDDARRLDALLFQDLWAGEAVVDPFYNPNFVATHADYT